MSGKKRKKPLKERELEFYTDTEPKVDVLLKDQTQIMSAKLKLLPMKLMCTRSYYLVQIGNSKPQ